MFKKKFLLIIALLSIEKACMSMHNFKKIAYSYPKITNQIKSIISGATAASVTYLAQSILTDQNDNSKKYLWIPALLGYSACYIYNYIYGPDLYECILLNPLNYLNHIHLKRKNFSNDAKKIDIKSTSLDQLVININNLIKRYEKLCPIFLLSECVEGCMLTRHHNPKYREAFENKAVELMVKELKQSTDKTINFVSFACGGMFQDFVILTKFLTLVPDAKIHIHMIDPKFTAYVKALDLSKNSRNISILSSIKINGIKDEIIKFAKENWHISEDENIANGIQVECLVLEASCKQFITCLTKKFKRAQIKFEVHESSSSYLNYIKTNKLNYPDIICCADIQDEMSLIRQSVRDFGVLSANILERRPSLPIIWLGVNSGKAQLMYLSLNNTSNSIKEEVQLSATNKKDIYMVVEEIKG